MKVETIKMADLSYMWLYGCRAKSVSAGLGYRPRLNVGPVCYAQGRCGVACGGIKVNIYLSLPYCHCLQHHRNMKYDSIQNIDSFHNLAVWQFVDQMLYKSFTRTLQITAVLSLHFCNFVHIFGIS